MKWTHRWAYLAMKGWWSLRRPTTVGVRVLLIRDGQILLVRHTYLRSWFAPGGGVKPGETLEQAARREAAEEAGATLGELQLFGTFTSFKEGKSDHVVMFLCTDFVSDGSSDHEIEEVRWFPLEDLPVDLSPATARRLREFESGTWPSFGPW